jgi:hypothetical protein
MSITAFPTSPCPPTPGLKSTRSSTSPRNIEVWRPQDGPQQALVDCPISEVFFGGARGGGKTDGVLGKWAIKEKRYGATFNAIAFRKNTTSFEDAIERSREIYGPLGGVFTERPPRWRMPNGGRVAFAYLENLKDADQYQGRNLTDAWVEEAGLYADPAPIFRLYGVLRSSHGVPVQLVLTANPGGPGQHWIRHRYELHPFPRAPRVLTRQLPNGKTRLVAVVPSRIENNKILLSRDPDYINRLYETGSKTLVRAWLEGDWSAVEGAFFDCWSDKMILRPCPLPDEWLRFRSGDWGSFSPYSFGWWAHVGEDFTHPDGQVIPKGALIRYRELYGSTDPAKIGKGLKEFAEVVARKIVRLEKADPKLSYGVLDPSTFKEDGGPSIAERINNVLLAGKLPPFHEADNARVRTTEAWDKRGPMSGLDHLRARMVGSRGVPMIYCFETCVASIRTIPTLQHDPARPEDIEKNAEDHAADEWRYAVLSRPWFNTKPAPEEPKDAYRDASDDLNDNDTGVLTL